MKCVLGSLSYDELRLLNAIDRVALALRTPNAVSVLPEVKKLGLRYSTDAKPGIERKRAGKGFVYLDPNGKRITDQETLSRIRSLVVPPAWSDVWISPYANGHLQATGRDAKGRKQAIYHADFRAYREETKFDRLKDFGSALPKIREKVDADLRRHGLPKEKVIAAVVHLLESTLIRIGNREYALQNKSFGLTTLQNQHLEIGAESLRFKFKGKSGKFFEIRYRDRRMARVVRIIQELPGQALFQFLDENGEPCEISSEDVNDYIREATGEDFTAKEFRTWKATLEAFRLLRDLEEPKSSDFPKIVKHVSTLLGNTPAVCRRSYIHPKIFEQALKKPKWLTAPLPRSSGNWTEPIEKLALEELL